MKTTTIIVILVILSGIGAGWYFLQKDKQDKAIVAHNKKKFQQIIQAARKSDSAGLLLMASTLNKYHKAKGQYPKNLNLLYPDFISDKAFISTLNWEYTTGKDSYTIKRSLNGKKSLFAMGPDLKLKTLRPKILSPREQPVLAKKQKKPAGLMTAKIISAPKTKPEKKSVATAIPSDEIKKPDSVKTGDIKSVPDLKPEFAFVKTELKKDEQFLHSFNKANFFIWKTREGVIGFSNIQYPDVKKLTIYRDNSWIEYEYEQN